MFTFTNILLGMLMLMMWVVASYTVRAGCSTMRVNKPAMTAAMLVTLLAAGGAVASQFALGMMMGMGSAAGLAATPEAADHLRLMMIMPAWMLVCATVYRVMLATTFGKAMVMFLMQVVMVGAMIVAFNMLANMSGNASLMAVRQMMPL